MLETRRRLCHILCVQILREEVRENEGKFGCKEAWGILNVAVLQALDNRMGKWTHSVFKGGQAGCNDDAMTSAERVRRC